MNPTNHNQNSGKDLLKKFLDRLGDRKMWPPLTNYSLFYFGSEYNSKKYFSRTPYRNQTDYSVIHVNDGVNSVLHLPMEPMINYSTEGLTRYLENRDFIDSIMKNFYKNVEEINKLYAVYTYQKIASEKIESLYQVIQKAFDLIHISNSSLYFSLHFDKEICTSVLKSLNTTISEKRFTDLWNMAIIPRFRSFDTDQEFHALSLIAQGRSIDEIAKECQYFYSTYKDTQLLPEVVKRLKEKYGALNAQDAQKKYQEMKTRDEANIKQHKDWLAELPQEERAIAEYCQIVMQARDNRKNFFSKSMTISWRIAERIFREAGIDSKHIKYVLPSLELVRGVEYVKSKKSEIEKREHGYVAYMPYEGGAEMAYDHCSEILKEANAYYTKREHQGSARVIKGQIGSKGWAKGKVRIILDADRGGEFKDGEILVTGMTRPEFVPLMKKAAAIVTDEGGITCHAAIVSRELKKPCVIGTKVASQILKDGDIVEVDANKGVVKILDK